MSLKSPCIGVCKFEPITGLCKACFRTRVEKRDWKRLAEAEQGDILALRPQREGELAALNGAPGKQDVKRDVKQDVKQENRPDAQAELERKAARKAKKARKAAKKARKAAKKAKKARKAAKDLQDRKDDPNGKSRKSRKSGKSD